MLLVSKLARVHLNLGTGCRLVSALGDSQLASAVSVAMCDRFTPSTNICLSGALTNACKPAELWVLSHRQFTLSSFSSAFLPPFLSKSILSLAKDEGPGRGHSVARTGDCAPGPRGGRWGPHVPCLGWRCATASCSPRSRRTRKRRHLSIPPTSLSFVVLAVCLFLTSWFQPHEDFQIEVFLKRC